MNILSIGFFVSSLALTTVAQTATVRGEVDEFPGSLSRFILEHTRIELVSTAVNLRALEDLDHLEFTVEEVAGSPNPTLRVLAARRVAETFDMDELEVNEIADFEVIGRSGAIGLVFLQATERTSFLPLGELGSWLLGPDSLPVGRTTIGGTGEGEVSVLIPNVPALIDRSFTGQAVIIDGPQVRFTNPDSVELERD